MRWRLLWRDTRYEDGRIPPEEADYLVYREEDPKSMPAERLRRLAGETCPRGGWWMTPAARERRHFEEGDTLPDVKSDWGWTVWQFEGGQ